MRVKIKGLITTIKLLNVKDDNATQKNTLNNFILEYIDKL